MTADEAIAAIGAVIGQSDPDPAVVAQTVTDLVAAVADLRTRVYASIVDGTLAAHGVTLP